MLRPATPLSVLFFAAFGLLLLSVLSTPIIKAIPLGSFQNVNFGVFGFCQSDSCSGIEIGYSTAGVFSSDSANSSFDLPTSTRATLSAILIVHPVAAGLTLVMFILAVVAHLHSPSHSSRYLLLVFILSIVDFLVCLLAFLIDVLLFVPHMAWGSYIVLAATILVALSGLVSCAMRRTIVSRKARKKRIAENAEMSGENYYNRQAQTGAATVTTVTAGGSPVQPTVPTLSGANGTDKLPEFVTYDKKEDRSSDERIPLTARSPSDRSPNTFNDNATSLTDLPYNGPVGPNSRRRSLSNPPGLRDEYGNPMPMPQDAYGVRRGPSNERMRGRGGMPPGGYRGRGGYPGPGTGGYGAPPPRGGYGLPGRGGYGPPPRGGYGPPPRGYGGPMRGGGGPPPPAYQGSPGPYGRSGSPYGGPPAAPGPYGARGLSPGPPSAPGYSNAANMNPSMPSLSTATGSYEPYNPEVLPRAESPPPLPGIDDAVQPGQAVEMDATTGSPQRPPAGFGQYGIRDSDADIAGIVAMQQGSAVPPGRHDTYMSEPSRYSQDEQYVPPRQGWNQAAGNNMARIPSPLRPSGLAPAAELPSSRGSPAPRAPPAAGEYYEDVDPRFAAEPTGAVPIQPVQATDSYEDIPQGARSPAESEHSTFTSISQRGINPRWNPGPPPPMMGGGGPGYGGGPAYGGGPIPRRPVQRPQDMLLNSNPDFELPTRGSPPRGARANMIPGSAYPARPL